MPNVYIIAGPNGAGKTTFARRFLPQYAGCVEFLNADMIAAGLSPFAPERSAMQAGRILLERMKTLADQRREFAFETTLSGRTYVRILRDMKETGYAVHMVYVWVSNVELSLERITTRVRSGGHDIPDDVARRRFTKSLRNLFHVYMPLLDSWRIVDNSGSSPRLVASEYGGDRNIYDGNLFEDLVTLAEQP